jgi:type IV secretion system protein VirB3
MVPGYNITIHNAFTTPLLLAGVPRTFAIMNGTICAAITLGLHAWYGIPVCAIVHGVAAYLTKKDPYFFSIMTRHIKQKPYYEV